MCYRFCFIFFLKGECVSAKAKEDSSKTTYKTTYNNTGDEMEKEEEEEAEEEEEEEEGSFFLVGLRLGH